jgi:hypothetical protein
MSPPTATAPDLATEASILAALQDAVALARRGDSQGARERSAALISQAQPLIAASPVLLRAALHALLVARQFRLLTRLIGAISGRRIELLLLPADADPIGLPRAREAPRQTTYTLDPHWLERLSPDDIFVRRLCNLALPVQAASAVREVDQPPNQDSQGGGPGATRKARSGVANTAW